MFRPTLRSSVKLLPRTAPSTILTSRLAAYRHISTEARSKIESAVKASPVVLFMKGTPAEPQCGFSRAVVQILELHGVSSDKMKTYNVLADQELRTGIKEYSEWPTIPQIYVNGEFVGGCDILLGMHQSGELETLLENNGVIPKVEDAPASPMAASS
ncbi:monothiol glutaredoxin-5 [Crassisporium funariophilum]|nr:monothiol glutaredoxin-5 [Crassisporium funariophilum]